MRKINILFFIFDLGGGGAEKVLVNLVNNLNPAKYNITVKTIFDGVNAKFLNPNINYIPFFNRKPFRGFSKFQLLFSPKLLHRWLIKDKYDIEIAFLQDSTTRIISGAPSDARKYTWVHSERLNKGSYRSEEEQNKCYRRFDRIAFVSKKAEDNFLQIRPSLSPVCSVVHNVNEVAKIHNFAKEQISGIDNSVINLCSIGRFVALKGYERLITVLGKLVQEGISNWNFYLLGDGELKPLYEKLILEHNIVDKVTFLGYQKNPYKYVSKMDLFVCSSIHEGYSTAVTESIVVGTPVLTTDCSGMDEILDNSGAGIIVPNNEKALYNGLKDLLQNPEKISKMKLNAEKRSEFFSTENAIREFEEFIGTF